MGSSQDVGSVSQWDGTALQCGGRPIVIRKWIRGSIWHIDRNETVQDQEDILYLTKKLKVNPKYYANDRNLLPHPLILELLDMVYHKAEETGVFALYAVMDVFTTIFLFIIYKSS